MRTGLSPLPVSFGVADIEQSPPVRSEKESSSGRSLAVGVVVGIVDPFGFVTSRLPSRSGRSRSRAARPRSPPPSSSAPRARSCRRSRSWRSAPPHAPLAWTGCPPATPSAGVSPSFAVTSEPHWATPSSRSRSPSRGPSRRRRLTAEIAPRRPATVGRRRPRRSCTRRVGCPSRSVRAAPASG